MKQIKKTLPFLGLAVWALLLLPFFLGAPAAHPATDDFTFAAYTRVTWVGTGSILHVLKDAVSYALRTWRDWQGTVTGVIVMTLNPAVFSLRHYGWHVVLLLMLDLAAMFVFLRHVLQTRMHLPKKIRLPLTFALSVIQLIFLPDIVEGIYWFNGAWFYTGANAAALLTLTLGDHWAASKRKNGLGILAGLLLFALGMDNYITAMMTAAALLVMALERLWAGEWKQAVLTALLLVPIGVGLLLSVIAPGNAVRMETDGAHQSGMGWLLLSVAWTMRDAAWFLVRFSLKTPLMALLFVFTPALCRALPSKTAHGAPPIWATLSALYMVLCAMIIPHMYSSGYAGSGRVVNMYHDYVVTVLPIAWILVLMRLKPKTRKRLSAKPKCIGLYAVSLAVLLLCVWGGQAGNYVKLVSDQLDGTQKAYIAQFEREYALCENGGLTDDVVLPVWTVQTMTGKPTAYEDASVWTNESMAHYFGVRSVRAEK